MSFQEKSAWGSLIGIGLVAYWFFPTAFDVAGSSNDPADLLVLSIGCIVGLIIIEAVYHSMVVNKGPVDSDERDALINLRAERNSGWVLAIGLFWLVGHIVAASAVDSSEPMGAMLVAVWILFTLTVSEFAKLASQVWYYRVDAA
ncbi:MAG: hypothetical protein ACR2QI_06470 [Woeseiaceae bacterium]